MTFVEFKSFWSIEEEGEFYFPFTLFKFEIHSNGVVIIFLNFGMAIWVY